MNQNEYMCQALELYPLNHPVAELIRHNENMTFKIIDASTEYVLRIHKPIIGFDNAFFPNNNGRSKVQNELEIIIALKENTSLPMQSPVLGLNGNFVQTLSEGTVVTLLEWVGGQNIDDTVKTEEIYKKIGAMTAEMHKYFFDYPEQHKTYNRYYYDQDLLPRIAGCLNKAMKIGIFTQEQLQDMLSALDDNINFLHPVNASILPQITLLCYTNKKPSGEGVTYKMYVLAKNK